MAAGPHYSAGALKALLFGRSYRALWAMPVRVAVLDPATFAGGLTPQRVGGGGSTKSLRMDGKDGRTYVFRSVDKDVFQTLGPEWEGTLAASIAQDQVSAKHPGAALAVPPLLEATGVLHVTPKLFVMADTPLLGEFREDFAGLLGILEERPDEAEDDEHPGFAEATRVASTERVLEHLDTGPQHRVDSRAYLTARLVDVLIGDWDRHADQWRWARFDRDDGTRVWSPIPRDRDNAFVSNDGLVPQMLRTAFPGLTDFRARSVSVYGLTIHTAPLDRRLLSDLAAETWDSVATAVGARITDAVIDAGIARLPAEYRAHSGAELAARLRARRDKLPEIAKEFYRQLASDVDVHATNRDDVAQIERRRDGAVELRLYLRGQSASASSSQPYFQRTFQPEETKEIRVYLQAGDDVAIVRGEAARSAVGLRVIGGDGNDMLVDSLCIRGGSARTAFYDDQGENVIQSCGHASLDARAYTPASRAALLPNAHPQRGWGSLWVPLAPSLEWKGNVGPVIGGGPVHTRYGFRHEPFARQMALRALFAPRLGRFGFEYVGDFRRRYSGTRIVVFATASDLEVTRFHGLGNETAREEDDGLFRVNERLLTFESTLHVRATPRITVFTGPVFRYTSPRGVPDAAREEPAVHGREAFGTFGAKIGAELDRRDSPVLPRHGVLLRVGSAGYPVVWGDVEPFATTSLEGSTYLTPPGAFGPTLALRAGGRRSWGDFPLQESAFIGGSETLRGYASDRYAGDAALFGGTELRARIAPLNLGVRGDFGVFGLADAARVYVAGESPGGWHSAYGGGLWFAVFEGAQVFSASYARGEDHRIYLQLGFGF